MEATIEAPKTLKEAEAVITLWQSKLQDAQQALAQHEQQLGRLALAGSAESATAELTRLQVDVTIATQAVEASVVQRKTVRRAEQAARVISIRAEAAELHKQAEEAAEIVNELGPKLAAARNRMEHCTRVASQMETQAGEIEASLRREAQS